MTRHSGGHETKQSVAGFIFKYPIQFAVYDTAHEKAQGY